MRQTLRLAACLLLAALASLGPLGRPAVADRAGDFDYYVLSLSWSPSWCATEGDARDPQCRPGARTAFVVHGLWPQYEQGWPQDCRTTARDPSRAETAAMADIMGYGGLAWYQWKKHGRCAGLPPEDYFQTLRAAAAAITVPPVLAQLARDVEVPATVLEDAFIEANPDLVRDGITVRCDGGRVEEVRICLTRELTPRACAPDSRRDCRGTMLMEQVR